LKGQTLLEEVIMYSRILVPLDGSTVAEQVLPYARFLAKELRLPVQLLQVIDADELTLLVNPQQGRYIDTLLGIRTDNSKAYLETIAETFPGCPVQCLVEKGKAAEVLIEQAADDKNILVVMATHGRSGIKRWLLGSVADKVLHGATNAVFLVRANEQGKSAGEAALKTVIVPLDGSPLAEQILPAAVDLATKIKLKVVLLRACALPPSLTAEEYGFYSAELLEHLEAESRAYVSEKLSGLKNKGLNVSSIVKIGYGAEEIITLARETPDNFIAMCTHGRSGVQRTVLGSVTERVVRHSGDPVLVIRAA
jgi:nucleotide-binding universal stress UspA family protein